MEVLKTSDHIQIKIMIPNPRQEPPTPSKAPNQYLKARFGDLEDAGGSWLGFGIFILIWIWSLVFNTSMTLILALYHDFEGAKNIHVF